MWCLLLLYVRIPIQQILHVLLTLGYKFVNYLLNWFLLPWLWRHRTIYVTGRSSQIYQHFHGWVQATLYWETLGITFQIGRFKTKNIFQAMKESFAQERDECLDRMDWRALIVIYRSFLSFKGPGRRWGRVPWSSGYGRRLMFRRSWVQIPAPVTGWTLFRYICCNYCGDVCLEIPKINNNRGPFKKVTQ